MSANRGRPLTAEEQEQKERKDELKEADDFLQDFDEKNFYGPQKDLPESLEYELDEDTKSEEYSEDEEMRPASPPSSPPRDIWTGSGYVDAPSEPKASTVKVSSSDLPPSQEYIWWNDLLDFKNPGNQGLGLGELLTEWKGIKPSSELHSKAKTFFGIVGTNPIPSDEDIEQSKVLFEQYLTLIMQRDSLARGYRLEKKYFAPSSQEAKAVDEKIEALESYREKIFNARTAFIKQVLKNQSERLGLSEEKRSSLPATPPEQKAELKVPLLTPEHTFADGLNDLLEQLKDLREKNLHYSRVFAIDTVIAAVAAAQVGLRNNGEFNLKGAKAVIEKAITDNLINNPNINKHDDWDKDKIGWGIRKGKELLNALIATFFFALVAKKTTTGTLFYNTNTKARQKSDEILDVAKKLPGPSGG